MIYDIIIFDYICNDISFDTKKISQETVFFSRALLKNSQKRGQQVVQKMGTCPRFLKT